MKIKEIYYLSYDGILTSLGYSQIFQYVLILSKIGRVRLISYEKSGDYENHTLLNKVNKEIINNRIFWIKKKYVYQNFKILHILKLLIHTIYFSIYFLFKKRLYLSCKGVSSINFFIITKYLYQNKFNF